MIAFDNGPADGDYVRYIEAMAREAASRVGMAPPAPTGPGFGDTMSEARERQAVARSAANTPAATAAVARAHALQAAGPAVLPALGSALALLVGGLAFVIVGLFAPPINFLVLGAGIVIVVIGFRKAANAVAALRDAARDRARTA